MSSYSRCGNCWNRRWRSCWWPACPRKPTRWCERSTWSRRCQQSCWWRPWAGSTCSKVEVTVRKTRLSYPHQHLPTTSSICSNWALQGQRAPAAPSSQLCAPRGIYPHPGQGRQGGGHDPFWRVPSLEGISHPGQALFFPVKWVSGGHRPLPGLYNVGPLVQATLEETYSPSSLWLCRCFLQQERQQSSVAMPTYVPTPATVPLALSFQRLWLYLAVLLGPGSLQRTTLLPISAASSKAWSSRIWSQCFGRS